MKSLKLHNFVLYEIYITFQIYLNEPGGTGESLQYLQQVDLIKSLKVVVRNCKMNIKAKVSVI